MVSKVKQIVISIRMRQLRLKMKIGFFFHIPIGGQGKRVR
jgi:hypothetical protein